MLARKPPYVVLPVAACTCSRRHRYIIGVLRSLGLGVGCV
ncbi:hypothetical protein HMPREF3214_00586 [Alloscardovia omnicolens]|nr:hypothetical protein HMPREF3214_00586 [Alloscardovia omnicolens]